MRQEEEHLACTGFGGFVEPSYMLFLLDNDLIHGLVSHWKADNRIHSIQPVSCICLMMTICFWSFDAMLRTTAPSFLQTFFSFLSLWSHSWPGCRWSSPWCTRDRFWPFLHISTFIYDMPQLIQEFIGVRESFKKHSMRSALLDGIIFLTTFLTAMDLEYRRAKLFGPCNVLRQLFKFDNTEINCLQLRHSAMVGFIDIGLQTMGSRGLHVVSRGPACPSLRAYG